jgi:hypothetical protein
MTARTDLGEVLSGAVVFEDLGEMTFVFGADDNLSSGFPAKIFEQFVLIHCLLEVRSTVGLDNDLLLDADCCGSGRSGRGGFFPGQFFVGFDENRDLCLFPEHLLEVRERGIFEVHGIVAAHTLEPLEDFALLFLRVFVGAFGSEDVCCGFDCEGERTCHRLLPVVFVLKEKDSCSVEAAIDSFVDSSLETDESAFDGVDDVGIYRKSEHDVLLVAVVLCQILD